MNDNDNPRRLGSFANYIKAKLRARASHFSWGAGDVEHLPKQDRSDHFAWKDGDVEHQPKKIDEDAGYADHIFKMGNHTQDHFPGSVELTSGEYQNQRNHRETYEDGHHYAHVKYKQDSYYINARLRNVEPPPDIHSYKYNPDDWKSDADKELAHHQPHLDHITSHRTVTPMHLYRGFGAAFPIHNLEPGHEFIDHGYTGTSRYMHIAGYGSTGHADEDMHYAAGSPHSLNMVDKDHPLANHHTIGMIHMPVGTKGHLLDHPLYKTPHDSEGEFLLHRGTKFRVLGHTTGVFNHNSPLSPNLSGVQGSWITGQNVPNKIHLVHMKVVDQP